MSSQDLNLRQLLFGLCHFLCKVEPESTVLFKRFTDEKGQFMISDSLQQELRGINEISFLFKRGAKQFSQVFCDRQTQVDSASAKPSPANYVRIFDSAVMLVEPNSSTLTYGCLASHVSENSQDGNGSDEKRGPQENKSTNEERSSNYSSNLYWVIPVAVVGFGVTCWFCKDSIKQAIASFGASFTGKKE